MTEKTSPRIAAIDVLRGFVMVVMSTDHASHVFNSGALFTDSVFFYKAGTPLPTAQFFTRWITHLCAPTFVGLAGTALAISTEKRKARSEPDRSIDRHIFVRGLLIVLFELLWMSPVMREPGKFLCQVLYAIGTSLIAMVVLRRLSARALFGVGLALAFGNELLVGFFGGAGALDTLPIALTVAGGFFFHGRLIVAYPTLPWLALMCLGWAFGQKLVAWRSAGKDEIALATRATAIASVVAFTIFGVFRAWNKFGNMRLFRESNDVVQWLHVSKYPPSITFDGLELGIALALLAALLRIGPHRILEPLRLLGQTALFYYLLHIHLLHLAAWATNSAGKFGIASAYVGGLGVTLVLYPACARYRKYKAAHPNGWARYI